MQINLDSLPLPALLTREPGFTPEEFWEISSASSDVRLERLANGDILIMTPTKRNTGSKSAYILRILGNWADKDGNGEYFDSSTGFQLLDGSILSPDACWVAFDRLKAAEADGKELPLAPDFLIELRSESDRLRPAREKMQSWMSNGVQLAWLVDPHRKAVEIYRPNHQPEIQEGQSAVYGEGPVGGFVLELGRIWG